MPMRASGSLICTWPPFKASSSTSSSEPCPTPSPAPTTSYRRIIGANHRADCAGTAHRNREIHERGSGCAPSARDHGLGRDGADDRSEEHTSELQSPRHL